MDWNKLSSIATFGAVLVALLPIYSGIIKRKKRVNLSIHKLQCILEDLEFIFDTNDIVEKEVIEKNYLEIDTVLSYCREDLPIRISEEIIYLQYVLRIYDESEDAKFDILKYIRECHTLISKRNKYFKRRYRKEK